MVKVLITGATGLIGSHPTELLVEKGFKVIKAMHDRDSVFRLAG